MTIDRKFEDANIAGLILAGGRGMRMGGLDKALVEYAGKRMIEHVAPKLSLLAKQIFISRQNDQHDLSKFGDIIFDKKPDQGPLSGLVTCLEVISKQGFEFVALAAVDTPVWPDDLYRNLFSTCRPHAVVSMEGRINPTIALIDLKHLSGIINLYNQGERRLGAWIDAKSCGMFNIGKDELINVNQFIKLL